ncbi:MAG TPA: PilN domain-containing protein [Gammaproteobacteria bacterium]|nr:PilN domain-containing protein [Gammaproteobacteria bacterium]
MTRINLLPWREERTKQRQKQLALMLAAAALAGLGVWFVGHFYYNGLINHQTYRNRILEQEIAALDKRIAKIKELEETKASLKARMEVVQELQQGRPLVVHLMHQLVATLPEGVYLTSVKQTNSNVVLTGVAESNARISSFMENLDSSDWLRDPRLSVIQVKNDKTRRLSEYTLQVSQKISQSTAKAPAPAAKKPAARTTKKAPAKKRG